MQQHGSLTVQMEKGYQRSSLVHSVNNTQLVSMVKDTDGPTVWSDGPRKKYDPKLMPFSRSGLEIL